VSGFESKKKSENTPVIVTQRAPICSEEVRNHKHEALSLQSWLHILAQAAPIGLALVVLVKCGFIMCDEDKAKVANCPRHKEARGKRELFPFVIPSVETTLMLPKLFHKPPSVFHHILPFMAI
jgi:hypothetical protein